jgi:uncharacterized protein YlaI
MKSRVVTCRKPHVCDTCQNTVIQKGDKAQYDEFRFAKYDDNDNQIGIQYGKYYMCEDCQKELDKDIMDAVGSLMIENCINTVNEYYAPTR